ncbi:MAG: Arc-like binding domain [Verrucomicrobiota bacterium]
MKAFWNQFAGMATLTIRNLPENLHALLKERARKNRRSLNQEVIAELSAVPDSMDDAARLADSRERMRRVTAEIDGIRSRMTGFMSGEEIDAAIEEGRG